MKANLVPVQEADSNLLLSWAEKPSLSEFFRRFPPVFAWSRPVSSMFPNTWFIEYEGKKVGICTLCNADPRGKRIELGLLIDDEECPKEVRRALYVDALYQLHAYAFETLGYHKVYYQVLANREKLAKFSISEGYHFEGKLRSHTFYKGEWRDELQLSITAEDYLSLLKQRK